MEFRQERLSETINGKTRSKRTINLEFGFLKRLITWSFKKNYIPFNSLEKFESLKIKDHERVKVRRTLTSGERYRLLRELIKNDHFKPIKWIVLISLYMGLRQNEIFSLTPKQFTSDDCIFLPKTKTGKERKVPMPKLISKRKNEIMDEGGEKWIFRRYHRFYQNSPIYDDENHIKSIKRSYRTLLKMIGISDFEAVDFHSLRHTCCSWWLNAKGVNPSIVQHWMGHKDLSTTMKYLHHDEELSKRAMQVI